MRFRAVLAVLAFSLILPLTASAQELQKPEAIV